jgi:hypothetical protein
MADLQEQIEDAANGPSEMTVDGMAVKQQPLGDLIRADRYLKSIAAAGKNHKGLRFNKIKPPGSS